MKGNNESNKDANSVVLNFLSKDHILVGEQMEGVKVVFQKTKGFRLVRYKRPVCFLHPERHQTLIERVLKEKAFTNWTRYSSKGTSRVERLRFNADGCLKENMVFQGDNLLVLHSLLRQFAGKIRMIYIDPMYNEDASTLYHDRFKHDTWLTFMQNRLVAASQLLREDGVIFISIGDREQAYLKVLCDEIFGRDNYISTISRVAKTASNKGKFFAPSIDYILCYARDKRKVPPFKEDVNAALYKKIERSGPRKGERYRDDVALYQSSLQRRPNQRYFIACPDGSFVIPPGASFPDEAKDGEKVLPAHETDKVWRWSVETYEQNKHLLVFKKTRTSPLLDQDGNQAAYNVYTKSYLKDRKTTGMKPRNFLPDFINRKAADYLKSIGLSFHYAKPVELITYLLDIIGSDKDDIVLDFFAGSGTTGHAVLEMNRKDGGDRTFILVEQLREHIDVCKKRLQKVMEDLPPGNDFVSCQIATDKEEVIKVIQRAGNHDELVGRFVDVCQHYNLFVDKETLTFAKQILPSAAFSTLSLEEQKRLCIAMLDQHELYVSWEDGKGAVDGEMTEDQALTKQFYHVDD